MIIYNQNDYFTPYVKNVFPLSKSPLIQCITNVITVESVVNALLYINAKPIMADDEKEFSEIFQQNDSLFLNLGHNSDERENVILAAAEYAQRSNTPYVIDLVGVAASSYRLQLAKKLLEHQPTIIKGNISEMRTFCGLASGARGVDSSSDDQTNSALHELISQMKELVKDHPELVLLATGRKDLVVSKNQAIFLTNGTSELDRFTGTGDIVGALITALLGVNLNPVQATICAVSYFNLCAEKAIKTTIGLANFRQETLNQLSLLMNQANWYEDIRGGTV